MKHSGRRALAGGCALAILAAAINTLFTLELGTSVSHLTGDSARFAISLGSLDSSGGMALKLALAILGFLFGALLAGFALQHPHLGVGSSYRLPIVAIGLIMLLAWALFPQHQNMALLLAASACGFQNALASKFRGLILRTTHITGLLTDLGANLGMRLRGHQITPWRIVVPALLIVSFFGGALAGAMLYWLEGMNALPLLAAGYFVAAIFLAGDKLAASSN